MLSSKCLECGADVALPSSQVGLKVTCGNCGKELEIVTAFGGTILLDVVLKPMNATCPECEATVALKSDVQKGEIVVCGDCGVDLEVVSTTPTITLALAPQEAEDWGE